MMLHAIGSNWPGFPKLVGDVSVCRNSMVLPNFVPLDTVYCFAVVDKRSVLDKLSLKTEISVAF